MDEYLAKKYGSKPKKTKKRKVVEDADIDTAPVQPKTQTAPQPQRAKGGWQTLSGKPVDPEEETVYRDASGNIISLDEQISVLQQRQQEKEAAERRKKENLLGAVQVEEAKKRQAKEEAMKHTKVTVHADDKAYNEERQSRAVYADPAAKFGKATPKATTSSSGALPSYTGSFPSNRFSIKPGCLWDGADRGNGFEAKWLSRQEEMKRQADVEYQNEMDF
ncbi:Pre-mRNA-splicing factor CWC26 [Yarrowia sp. B02]|nr:Pre-mRNA-splicing factor CWC26 [Yarrowia sp. B02]